MTKYFVMRPQQVHPNCHCCCYFILLFLLLLLPMLGARTKFEMCAACAEWEVELNGLSLGDTRVA